MKLRIRSLESKETLKIETPISSTLQHLKVTISQKIQTTSSDEALIHISLNRKDELIASPNESLQSLGITSGDLIFYTLNPHGFSSPAAEPPVSPIQSPIPPQNLEQALEPKNTWNESNDTSDQNVREDQSMDVDQQDETLVDHPIEISSPFPSFLTKVCKEEAEDNDKSDFKLSIVALHAVMLESGFVCFDSVTKRKIDGSHLPDGWSSSLQYTIPDILVSDAGNAVKTVCLKFQNWGKFLNVYGSLNQNNSLNLYRLCLDKIRFIPSITFARMNLISGTTDDSSISFHVKEVFEFWKIVKDGLALPLLIDLCEITGLALPPCFMRLPTDLKLGILEFLPGLDLAKVGCVSWELKYLSSNNNLWKRKVMEEFPLAVEGAPPTDNWRKEFVRLWSMTRRRTRLRIPSRRGRAPNPFVNPLRRGRFPYGPYAFPCTIGGDYDLFPAPFGSSSHGLGFPARRNPTTHCHLHGFDA